MNPKPLTRTAAPLALSEPEQQDLLALEATVRAGLQTFYEAGRALKEIRERKLYRAEFDTFERYCQERWDVGESHANQMVRASMVVDTLKASGSTSVPANEAQARVLAPLSVERQRQVWETSLKTAPKGVITASHLKVTLETLDETREKAENKGRGASDLDERDHKVRLSGFTNEQWQLYLVMKAARQLPNSVRWELAEAVGMCDDVKAEIARLMPAAKR